MSVNLRVRAIAVASFSVSKDVVAHTNTSRNVRRRAASPACIAAVRVSRPNGNVLCGRTTDGGLGIVARVVAVPHQNPSACEIRDLRTVPPLEIAEEERQTYICYYHEDRCHLGLHKDTPNERAATPRPSLNGESRGTAASGWTVPPVRMARGCLRRFSSQRVAWLGPSTIAFSMASHRARVIPPVDQPTARAHRPHFRRWSPSRAALQSRPDE